MSKRYTLRTATGEDQNFAKKDAAIRAGEKIGEDFMVLSPAGATVYGSIPDEDDATFAADAEANATSKDGKVLEETPELADEDRPMTEEEVADLLGEIAAPEASSMWDFPGNYSIAFIPFAQTLADAVGGLETSVVKPGGLTREFHFEGSKAKVAELREILDDAVPATLEGLRIWQKENRETRRGLTDMQKFIQHRQFIENRAKTISEQL